MSRLGRERLDKILVDRGLVASRERAQRLVMAGAVFVDQRPVAKPGTLIASAAVVEVRGADIPYVSRGGLKLEAALRAWPISVRDNVALDVGASTGGWTDCLLQHGARHVYAVDVGYGQFAWSLRQDSRVTLLERTNIRTAELQFDDVPTLAVVDVSFISLSLVLPRMVDVIAPTATIVSLVKPQFEVGKGQVGKGGVVRDAALQRAAIEAVRSCAARLGLHCRAEIESPIFGAAGNREFLLWLEKRAD